MNAPRWQYTPGRGALLVADTLGEMLTFGDTPAAWAAADGITPTSRKIDDGPAPWSGAASWEQTREHAAGIGWDISARVAATVDTLAGLMARVPRRKTVFTSAVCGGAWNNPDVISGAPLAARVAVRVNTNGPARVVRVLVNNAAACSVSVEKMAQAGVAVAALAEALRRAGMAAEIWAGTCCTAGGRKQLAAARGHAVTLTRVAAAGVGRADVAALTFGIAHPGMLRRVFFAAAEQLSDPYRAAYGVPGAYGIPATFPAWVPESIGATLVLNTELRHGIPDPAAWVRRQMAAVGVHIPE